MRAVSRFGRFWWDFVVGDDWRVAAGVVVGVAARPRSWRSGSPPGGSCRSRWRCCCCSPFAGRSCGSSATVAECAGGRSPGSGRPERTLRRPRARRQGDPGRATFCQQAKPAGFCCRHPSRQCRIVARDGAGGRHEKRFDAITWHDLVRFVGTMITDVNPFIYSHPLAPDDIIDRDEETSRAADGRGRRPLRAPLRAAEVRQDEPAAPRPPRRRAAGGADPDPRRPLRRPLDRRRRDPLRARLRAAAEGEDAQPGRGVPAEHGPRALARRARDQRQASARPAHGPAARAARAARPAAAARGGAAASAR